MVASLLDVLRPLAPGPRGRMPAYAQAGVPHYWVVAPTAPSLTVYPHVDGPYVEAHHAEGSQRLSLEEPVAVDLAPAELVAGR